MATTKQLVNAAELMCDIINTSDDELAVKYCTEALKTLNSCLEDRNERLVDVETCCQEAA